MYTSENKPLDPNHWHKRFYHDENGDIRNKIRRGPGKRQQKGAIATYTMGSIGYLRVVDRINGELVWVYAHRLAVFLHTGKDPCNLEINHKNQDKADNRIENLEVLPHDEHARKHPKLKTCTSGITGVCWHKRNKTWQVQIGAGKNKRIRKCFTDFFEACCYRKSMENKLGYFPEHGKTPEEVRKYYEDLEAENA